ncbi:MAG: hypothetical protein IKH63_09420 [Prevotella sp.]|nr:hypothetical protein [Prevotella sp.]
MRNWLMPLDDMGLPLMNIFAPLGFDPSARKTVNGAVVLAISGNSLSLAKCRVKRAGSS